MEHRRPLPRGTPTFLFTDIEGSTRLLQRLGDRYARVRARHVDLLTQAFEDHGGVIFGSEGDALFVAFETAAGAVAGALAGQQALRDEPWPEDAAIRVRMGMHSGEVAVVDDDYVGMTVHIAARVAAAGHGGQVLATEVTVELAGDPPTRDLGRHELKDVGEHRILQLVCPGLDDDFPPLKVASSPHPTNLPAAVDVFIGRGDELDELLLAIDGNRLVTLTGPGGAGKTRLALEAARAALQRFRDGVWFVDLAAVDADERVVSAVAQALSVREGHEALADSLAQWLRGRDLLLVLDNCEQVVVGAGAFAVRFLAACPDLRILATSRSFLGVRGEHGVQTPPMRLPDAGDDRAAILASDAVELFLARAVSAAPAFDVGAVDLVTLAAVCRRLDGLPLAIELAAARLRVLSLEQLAARLDDRFRLLRSGPADVTRHQTLAAVVQWSYDLLAPDEQRTFERLGVFPHRFSLEMAEAVVAAPPISELDVVDLLSQLLEKSLIAALPTPDGMRYQMLETLRAFAIERLAERGEEAAVMSRLLAWSISVVDHLEAAIRTPAMDDALRSASRDAVTHRSAARWAATQGHAVPALRVAAMVPLSIHRTERVAELRSLLRAATDRAELDPVHEGHAWAALGNILFEVGDWAESAAANRRAVTAFERAGDLRLAGWSRYLLAHSHWGAGELDEVDRAVEVTIEGFRTTDDRMGLGYALWVAAMREAELSRAEELAAEADLQLRTVGVPNGIAHNVEGRGIIALEDGRLPDAARYVAEAVRIFAEYDNLGCAAHALEAAAVVLSPSGPPDPVAVQLLAAAERFRLRSGQSHRPWEVRARGGATAGRVRELDAATSAAPSVGEPVLEVVAALACGSLDERLLHEGA